jgi:hypothetical protein
MKTALIPGHMARIAKLSAEARSRRKEARRQFVNLLRSKVGLHFGGLSITEILICSQPLYPQSTIPIIYINETQ